MLTNEYTHFLAQLYGALYVLAGIGMIFNSDHYQQFIRKLTQEGLAFYSVGVFTFIMGFIIVFVHNIWQFSLAGIVTVLGWLTLIKGASFIIAPNGLSSFYSKFGLSTFTIKASGVIVAVLGSLLFYCARA